MPRHHDRAAFEIAAPGQALPLIQAVGGRPRDLQRMQAEPVSGEELSLATSYLDGVFPIRFESTAAIAGALATLVIHGLPEDYYDRYRERVRAMTVDQILDAAKR